MKTKLTRLFLDTNVYILGADNLNSHEGQVLEWLGFWQANSTSPEVIISAPLLEQISRVAKRLKNKDWSGELIGNIWQNLKTCYVLIDFQALLQLETLNSLPREDLSVYLTAKVGKADCFISANHELIKALPETTREFECLTPADFAEQYL